MDGFSAVRRDEERPLAADVVDQQLEERVYRKGLTPVSAYNHKAKPLTHSKKKATHLVDIPDRVQNLGQF